LLSSIIDLSKIANEDLKTIITELILRKILRCMTFNRIEGRTFLVIDEVHRISKKKRNNKQLSWNTKDFKLPFDHMKARMTNTTCFNPNKHLIIC
jgi:predicted PolB exonuclease-like 3'-5' exonuclease